MPRFPLKSCFVSERNFSSVRNRSLKPRALSPMLSRNFFPLSCSFVRKFGLPRQRSSRSVSRRVFKKCSTRETAAKNESRFIGTHPTMQRRAAFLAESQTRVSLYLFFPLLPERPKSFGRRVAFTGRNNPEGNAILSDISTSLHPAPLFSRNFSPRSPT